jgi:hypothetical protein
MNLPCHAFEDRNEPPGGPSICDYCSLKIGDYKPCKEGIPFEPGRKGCGKFIPKAGEPPRDLMKLEEPPEESCDACDNGGPAAKDCRKGKRKENREDCKFNADYKPTFD